MQTLPRGLGLGILWENCEGEIAVESKVCPYCMSTNTVPKTMVSSDDDEGIWYCMDCEDAFTE